MRVHKSPTLSPVFLSIFIVAICMFGIAATNVQAATFTVMNANDGGAGSLRDASRSGKCERASRYDRFR